MFNWKYPLGILCALSLLATVPDTPARAGDGSSIAAGIVGAIGSAIIMNQLMHGARISGGMRPHVSRRRIAHPRGESSGEAANSRDPFAGESAPAGYAKPVTDNK